MKRICQYIAVGFILGSLIWVVIGPYIDWEQILISSIGDPVSAVPIISQPTPTRTPYQPLTDTSTPSATPLPTATFTITPTPTPSKTPTPSQTPSPTSTSTPLKEAKIQDIRGRWAAFSLSCEARSAVDWAAYFGVQIDEIVFLDALPVSDDPNVGFVGDVHAPWGQTPPNPYGVYALPVADLLRFYGLKAQARQGMTFDELRAEISADRPVIVWVVGRVGEGTPIAYTSSEGVMTTVARFEHTVIVIGYDQQNVTVLDGYWVYTRSIQDFLNSWSVLGNMAVIWGSEDQL